LALIGFGTGILYSLYKIGQHFEVPNRDEILSSLEAQNAFLHRPLRSADATLTASETGNKISSHLWQLHQGRQKELAGKTKTGWPQLNLGEGDKYSLRSGIILLMITGYFIGGEGRSLQAALTPDFSRSNSPIEVDVWAAPPEYTKMAPRLLKIESKGEGSVPAIVKLPIGSRIIARVSGGGLSEPALVQEDVSHTFLQVDPKNYELELQIEESGNIRVENDGELLARWDIAVIPDLVPVVALKSIPQITERVAFSLRYTTKDDYGVAGLVAKIQRTGDDNEISLKLSMAPGSTDIEGKSYHD